MPESTASYWDLTPQERADLLRDDVEKYIDHHLMTKGVLKPKPLPEFTEKPTFPELTKQEVFVVEVPAKTSYGSPEVIIEFGSRNDAEQFLNLQPLSIYRSYDIGSDVKYTEALEAQRASISTQLLPTHDTVMRAASQLKAFKAETEAREKALSDYKKAMKAVDSASNDVWEDWYEQCGMAREVETVQATFKEYERLSQGEQVVALNFLRKSYPREKLLAIDEWIGGDSKLAGPEPEPEVPEEEDTEHATDTPV